MHLDRRFSTSELVPGWACPKWCTLESDVSVSISTSINKIEANDHGSSIKRSYSLGKTLSYWALTLHPHPSDFGDHLQNLLEAGFLTLQPPPSGTHTESSGSVGLSLSSRFEHGFDIDQSWCFGWGFVRWRLRAVGTIFSASSSCSGLDLDLGLGLGLGLGFIWSAFILCEEALWFCWLMSLHSDSAEVGRDSIKMRKRGMEWSEVNDSPGNPLLIFISVHNWIREGSWCILWTVAWWCSLISTFPALL